MKIRLCKYKSVMVLLAVIGLTTTGAAFAAESAGDMASQILSSFGNLAKLITAGSFIAGLAFAVGAIMKFKQHKDNPTQIPIGTPIALVFIAAALLFLPTILGVAGQTMFGTVPTDDGVKGVTKIGG